MKSGEVKNTAHYDRELFLNKHQNSARFDKLNPGIVRELFTQRPDFKYVKEVAVALLEKTISDQFDALTLENRCDLEHLETVSKNVFSWSNEEFLKRISLEDCVWIDVIKNHEKGDCLDRLKLQVDLKDSKKFLKIIFNGLIDPHYCFNLKSLVWKPLLEVERNLNILETFQNKKIKLKEMLREQNNLINANLLARRNTPHQNLLWEIEGSTLDAQTTDPIQTRYKINWYKCKTEQLQLKSDNAESYNRKKLSNYKFKLFCEEMSGNTIRDTYYALAEQYKQNIETLQNRFNLKLDDVENKINYTRLEISKLEEHQKFLRKQIEKFHEDIEIRLKKEENRRIKQELENLKVKEDEVSNIQKDTKKNKGSRKIKNKS